jgi:hypothetical protein
MVLNATFNNISVILWQPVLLVEETGVAGENHRPARLSFPMKKNCFRIFFYIISENYFIRKLKWNVSFPGKICYMYLNIHWRYLVTWVLPEFYLSFTWVLPEFYQSFTWVLPEFYLSFMFYSATCTYFYTF